MVFLLKIFIDQMTMNNASTPRATIPAMSIFSLCLAQNDCFFILLA